MSKITTEELYLNYVKAIKDDVIKLSFAICNLDETVCSNDTTNKLTEILQDYMLSLNDYIWNAESDKVFLNQK